MAGYVIHLPDGLSSADEARVDELVGMEVKADGPPAELAERAGFSVLACEDATEQFRTTCRAIVRAREEHEQELRAVDGDEAYEEDQARKANVLTGIEDGLLERSLIVVAKG